MPENEASTELEPIQLFGAKLDIQEPKDLPPFVYMAVQDVLTKLGHVPTFVLVVMLGAALTHHSDVRKTVQSYDDAKRLPRAEQDELVMAGSSILNVFTRAVADRTGDDATDAEGDAPNDSTPEAGGEASSEEPTLTSDGTTDSATTSSGTSSVSTN